MDRDVSPPAALHGQHGFRVLRRDLHAEGVHVEGQDGITAQEVGKLGQPPHAKLGQGRVKGCLADSIGAEELPRVVENDGLVIRQVGKLPLLPQVVNYVVPQTLPCGLRRRGRSR